MQQQENAMKIVVIGGTGLIGSQTVAKLRAAGHEAVAASPASGVNTVTGEGLAEVLAGANAVVDVANSPSFADETSMDFFRQAGAHLLAAEQAAGVGHHVALSVVGTERLQAPGYFRAKLVQEQLIVAAAVPYTIVRATNSSNSSGVSPISRRARVSSTSRERPCSRWPPPMSLRR
jgi:uncharacterized protein YbjT (DUF2867 family)